MGHSQVSVCVLQYSPNRPATLLPVWMEGIATKRMEATPVTADTDTGGSTVKKVEELIQKWKSACIWIREETLSKHPLNMCIITSTLTQQQL